MSDLRLIEAEDVLEHTQIQVARQWLGLEYKKLMMYPYPKLEYSVIAGSISEDEQEQRVNLTFPDLRNAVDMYNSVILGEGKK